MDCERTRGLLSDYLEEGLTDGDRAVVAAHLEACARCAAEAKGLSETIALLAALPREKAPPELLGRVMGAIERETAEARGSRRPFPPRRLAIPIEAAAAVLLMLVVYGIQRELPDRSGLPAGEVGTPTTHSARIPDASPPISAAPPPARTARAEPPAVARNEEPVRPAVERAAKPAPTADRDLSAPPAALARAESREAGFRAAGLPSAGRTTEIPGAVHAERAASAHPAAPALPTAPALPAAKAARVSSAGEAIEPRVFAAPPSRMLEPLPFGREVTLEVAFADRSGIEERIVAAAERLGGGAHPGAIPRAAGEQSLLPAPVRVHLPADSAGAFLDALNSLGKIPPDGMPAAADLPAGPSPDAVAYTIRIRVR